MKWSDLNLATATDEIIESSNEIVRKGIASSMRFDTIQNMSSEDIEMMRECSKLWSMSTEYAMKVAVILDQIPEIKKEQETIKKQLEECQSLLREIARREA